MPERILCYLALGGNIGVTYPMSNTLLRTLSALKRHTFCRSFNSLATSSTFNHFGWHHSKGANNHGHDSGFITLPNPFELPLQILVLFQFFLFRFTDSCVEGARYMYYETFSFFVVHYYNVRLACLHHQICLNFVFSDSRTAQVYDYTMFCLSRSLTFHKETSVSLGQLCRVYSFL